jgi:hypothetical protein
MTPERCPSNDRGLPVQFLSFILRLSQSLMLRSIVDAPPV